MLWFFQTAPIVWSSGLIDDLFPTRFPFPSTTSVALSICKYQSIWRWMPKLLLLRCQPVMNAKLQTSMRHSKWRNSYLDFVSWQQLHTRSVWVKKSITTGCKIRLYLGCSAFIENQWFSEYKQMWEDNRYWLFEHSRQV